MLVLTDDNPFELLEINGYSRYGLGDWSWVKSEKKGRFHCVIDYNKESFKLHFDKVNRNGNFTHHKCEQNGGRVIEEIRRIKQSTFNGKLDLLKEDIFKTLCQIK